MSTLLTIAGHDPSSGAGITADLAVFAAHGHYGISCITALTVQSTLGVAATHPVSAGVLAHMLRYVTDDLPPRGIKIGMLGTAECVEAVADYLESLDPGLGRPMTVLDPVLRSTSGKQLLDAAGLETMQRRLLPLIDWVTPNGEELAILVEDSQDTQSSGRDAMLTGARELQTRFPGLGVLVTGGDQDPPDDLVVTPGDAVPEVWLPGEWVATTSTHGTGCALSSAFLSRLVLGDAACDAARSAKSM